MLTEVSQKKLNVYDDFISEDIALMTEHLAASEIKVFGDCINCFGYIVISDDAMASKFSLTVLGGDWYLQVKNPSGIDWFLRYEEEKRTGYIYKNKFFIGEHNLNQCFNDKCAFKETIEFIKIIRSNKDIGDKEK